jgi:hypothetical protein
MALRVAVLGCALPEKRFQEIAAADEGERFANQRYGTSLLEALIAGGARPTMISAAPATDFPHNRHLTFPHRRYVVAGVPYVELPYANVMGIKHATRWHPPAPSRCAPSAISTVKSWSSTAS